MTGKAFDGRVLLALLVLNLAVHFVPFERPGFQTDDFMWLHHSRVEPEWSFVPLSLSQETRPLGWLLYILTPKLVGLHAGTQLFILVSLSSVLTGLVYVFLAGLLSKPQARLASVAYVLWPVKHEIYSSQVVGTGILAAILIVAAGLLYRLWARQSDRAALFLSVVAYGLSIFVYELGYLAPLVYYLTERSRKAGMSGLAPFLIPAFLYWALRLVHSNPPNAIGDHAISPLLLAFNIASSLPSNLLGFQLARNIGYGLWGVVNASPWFQFFCVFSVAILGVWCARLIGQALRETAEAGGWKQLAAGGLVCATLLALPSAMVLVESRHSILASVGMGVAIAAIASRVRPAAGALMLVVLGLSAQGLAFRQVEVGRLQASVYEVIVDRKAQILEASVVVFDLASLAERVSYTWGERETNVLRGYWGIFAFSSGGFAYMVDDVLYRSGATKRARVSTCATRVEVSETAVRCARSHAGGRPFTVPRSQTLVIDFKAMPLPSTLRPAPVS